MDDVGSSQWWRRLHDWADIIHADFQTVMSRYLHNISSYTFCTAERMLRTIIMQNSGLIQACFPIKIDEVWIDGFCVRYDWWRRHFGCSRRHQCPQCGNDTPPPTSLLSIWIVMKEALMKWFPGLNVLIKLILINHNICWYENDSQPDCLVFKLFDTMFKLRFW